LPRIEQRLPFFEVSSEKRSTESWWNTLQENLSGYGLKVKKLVSDRASALVELGKSEYFGVGSMPDLFHFNQPFAQSLGAAIGKAWKKSLKAHQDSKGYYSHRKPLEDEWLRLDICRRRCQNGFFGIHKAITPLIRKAYSKNRRSLGKK